MYDCISVQELGAVCPALVTYLEIAQLFGHALRIGGTEKQRQKYLPQIVDGVVGAYALTDHTPGSDPANMFTTATKMVTDGTLWAANDLLLLPILLK